MLEHLNPLSQYRADERYLIKIKEVACLASDDVGSPVAIRDVRVNGKWRVETADPFDEDKMPAIGIMVEKTTPTVGKVLLFGPCDIFTGMTPGKALLVGSGGNLLEAVPSLIAGQYFWAQQIGHAVSDDLLMLPGNPTMIRYGG